MAVNNFIRLLKNKKYFKVADISGKLSRNTFVNYKTPKYFTGRQVLPNLGGINYGEHQRPPCEIKPRGCIKQAGY